MLATENMEKLKRVTKMVYDIIERELAKLPYFDATNYKQNSQTLKKIVAEGNFNNNNQIFAFYGIVTNTIYILESGIPLFTEEELVILLLHEFIHFFSSNIQEYQIGFENKSLPLTYNEGLTQWLTLKIIYKDNLDKALKNNKFYPETVLIINDLVNEIGENIIFNGFFNADITKSISLMNQEDKSKWINTIIYLFNSKEEKQAKNNLLMLDEEIKNISFSNSYNS